MPIIEDDHSRFKSYMTAHRTQAAPSVGHRMPQSRPRAYSGGENNAFSAEGVPSFKEAL